MKQTVVNWIHSKILLRIGLDDNDIIELRNIVKEAKEMEKEQAERMYNEEELKSAFKIGFNIAYGSPVQELDLKNEHCEKWFKHFKKNNYDTYRTIKTSRDTR